MDYLMYCLYESLSYFTETWFICFLCKYLFLKNYTKKQKQIFQIMFYFSGIITLTLFIVWLKKNDAASTIETVFVLMGMTCILYANIAGRKKAGWVGIFYAIPLFGYTTVFNIVTESITMYLLDTVRSRLLVNIIFYLLVLLVIFYLSNEKIRPKFVNDFEQDMKHMRYSVKEGIMIWIIGIWWAIYGILRPSKTHLGFGIFKNASPAIMIFIDILIFAFGFTIVFVIINSSYRRYYYEKNLKYQKTLITTMANLVESRDDNTGGHIHRTAKYAEIIARKLQKDSKYKNILTDRYIEDMVIAAPLHDVGKIHISDMVLNKPGRLNDEEFAAMKTHSAAGGEIISQVEKEVDEDISYLAIAREMAEYHHERMDGKGYPHGISGEEIPLCARILAVADVFDALISKRCYKDAMPLDKAFAIIKEETGDHFDSNVAQAFLDSREEVEQFLHDISEEEKVEDAAEAN